MNTVNLNLRDPDLSGTSVKSLWFHEDNSGLTVVYKKATSSITLGSTPQSTDDLLIKRTYKVVHNKLEMVAEDRGRWVHERPVPAHEVWQSHGQTGITISSCSFGGQVSSGNDAEVQCF